MSDMSEPAHNGPGRVIENSRLIRLLIFILSNALIATSSVFSVVSWSQLAQRIIVLIEPHPLSVNSKINFETFVSVSIPDSLSLNASDALSLNDSISNATNQTSGIDIEYYPSDMDVYQSIETAPVYLFCCALSLASISAFLRAGFVLKFLAMIVCIGVQGCVLELSDLYRFYGYTVNDG